MPSAAAAPDANPMQENAGLAAVAFALRGFGQDHASLLAWC